MHALWRRPPAQFVGMRDCGLALEGVHSTLTDPLNILCYCMRATIPRAAAAGSFAAMIGRPTTI